ncbi:NUDIX domain-containing protein [Kingella kingae]|uniref:NUDIX domain-containing protein n=1 Tax=Kingella kingae TaxID=504 RepID=UPI000666808C|nr:NUDIX domain-containing protein [Kingella kingae]
MRPTIEVVAGIVLNEHDEVLLSSRPAGKAYAGFWEFAGGKVEQGETQLAALQREFAEELGIEILAATPWLAKVYAYEHALVHLRFFRVATHQWQGSLQSRENQQWAWQKIGQFDVSPMLPANQDLLRALAFPQQLAGSLHSVLHYQNWRLVHASQATSPQDNVWLSLPQAQQQGALPQGFSSVWLLIECAEQVQAACDADGLLWHIADENSAKAACTALSAGCSQPIILLSSADLVAQFATQWRECGAQAVCVHEETSIA